MWYVRSWRVWRGLTSNSHPSTIQKKMQNKLQQQAFYISQNGADVQRLQITIQPPASVLEKKYKCDVPPEVLWHKVSRDRTFFSTVFHYFKLVSHVYLHLQIYFRVYKNTELCVCSKQLVSHKFVSLEDFVFFYVKKCNLHVSSRKKNPW